MAETYNFLYEVPSNTLKAFEDYKNKQKKYEVMFFDMYVYSENVSNNRDKTWKLKKFPLHKKNGTKIPSFFFCEFQLVTVLLLFYDLYMSWSTSFVSLKLCLGFSILDSVSFLLKFIILLKKMHGLFDFKRHI